MIHKDKEYFQVILTFVENVEWNIPHEMLDVVLRELFFWVNVLLWHHKQWIDEYRIELNHLDLVMLFDQDFA